MRDQLSDDIARLTAEQQEIRASALDTATKRKRLADIQAEINGLMATRRLHQAQRTNGASPMEQRGRRY